MAGLYVTSAKLNIVFLCVNGKALPQATKWIWNKILESSASGWQHLFPRHTCVSRQKGEPPLQDVGPLHYTLFQRQSHKGSVDMKITQPRVGQADCL